MQYICFVSFKIIFRELKNSNPKNVYEETAFANFDQVIKTGNKTNVPSLGKHLKKSY